MLNWDKLLSEKRIRYSEARLLPHRNGFDMDYDRIIYSSSLRRLQDKAQVFPLQENDFIRTRLTHSLEASALGRSLGFNIGDWLEENKKLGANGSRKLSSLLAVTCLVHDLGNPPFGHYGEDIIRQWFIKFFSSSDFNKLGEMYKAKFNKDIITEQEKMDFIHFEGNAQTIRILTKLQFLNDQYGANFSLGTLSTLIKYPYSSLEHDHSNGKIGYFSSESDTFEKIREGTELPNGVRHPATYLLEAADDIAYLAADIEDGVKKGAVPWEYIYNDIKDKIGNKYRSLFDLLERHREKAKTNKVPDIDLINAQNFKVAIQGEMFNAVAETFKQSYDKIMHGEFSGELLERSSACDIAKILKNIGIEYCYCNEEVLTLELVGNRVIETLLDLFVDAVINDNGKFKTKCKTGKLFNLISSNFRYIQTLDDEGNPTRGFEQMSLYNKLMLITDFISGMTDSYAVSLHQKLTGIKLP